MSNWNLKIVDQEGVTAALSTAAKDNLTAVFVKAEKEKSKPYFGPQSYLDAEKGIQYHIKNLLKGNLTAIYQHKDWWVRPAFIKEGEAIPARTQLLIGCENQTYTIVLAVCGKECRTDLSGTGEELLVTIASNQDGCKQMEDLSLVIAQGSNPYLCIEEAVMYALELLGQPQMLRTRRTYPELFEYFGWCSWDAFYHKVNAEGIYQKLDELKLKEIPVKWVLIDDGWMTADYENQELIDLDAAPEKFPGGLGTCVRRIKEDYEIPYVGVWHAVMGYWNGLQTDSPASKKMAAGSYVFPDGRVAPEAKAGSAFAFYDVWHSYLKEKCGIDFVKVDGQSAISLFYKNRENYVQAAEQIHRGLDASAAVNFGGALINCMGMASEDMWHRPSSAVSRSSDDFVPDVPHGFREHAIQNSYNTLLQGQFYWGDWDMFWSDHEENWQNSILRAVSGGPVYVSDAVSRTDAKYILPLILADGRVLRCDSVGMPTLDCLLEDPVNGRVPLKIFNRKNNAYVVSALNISREDIACSGTLKTSDIPGLQDGEWIVYAWKEQRIYYLNDEKSITFTLQENDGELFQIIPEDEIQLLGLTDKYVGTAAVLWQKKESGKVRAMLQQGGKIGIYCAGTVTKILCDGSELPFSNKENLWLTEYESTDKVYLEIEYTR